MSNALFTTGCSVAFWYIYWNGRWMTDSNGSIGNQLKTVNTIGTEINHKSHPTQCVSCFPLQNIGYLLNYELSLNPGLLWLQLTRPSESIHPGYFFLYKSFNIRPLLRHSPQPSPPTQKTYKLQVKKICRTIFYNSIICIYFIINSVILN